MPSPISQSRVFFRDDTPQPLGHVSYAGTIQNSPGLSRKKLRVFGQYALVLCVTGGGIYRDFSGFQASIQRGDLIWVFPEIPHFYGPKRGEKWDEIYACFSGPVFDLWRREGLLDPARPVCAVEGWRSVVEQLSFWCEKPRATDESARLKQLHDFLAILAGLVAPVRAQNDVWARAKSLLEAHLSETISPQEVARKLGLGYDTFRKGFVGQTGVSPAKYRDLARVEAAKTLLLRDDVTQRIVAQSLGFRDEAHFSRRFREICGQSPREFRARKQKTPAEPG